MSKSIHAILIGLYGISGCGKSFLLEKLRSEFGESKFQYFEGSEEIDSITPGGLNDFKKLSVAQQTILRKSAIESIKSMCNLSGKTGIVTGHYSFWQSESEPTSRVWTTGDAESYTHIVYVNTPVEEIVKQRQDDRYRSRPILSAQHLKSWQDLEMKELRKICYQYGILFTALFPNLKDKLPQLLLDFQGNSFELNDSVAERNLECALSDHYDELETVVFFDSDKTLAANDTGKMFWKMISSTEKSPL